MRRNTILFLVLLFAGAGMAFTYKTQNSGWNEMTIKEYDELIKKAGSYFDGPGISFSVEVSFSSFKTHTSAAAHETQNGYCIRSGKNYHHYMMGIHTLQNKNFCFVVDSTEKNIMIAEPAGEISEKIFMGNYKQFHSQIQKVYRLSQKENDKIRITFSEKARVSHIEMEFDKKGLIRKSVSYFRIKLKEDPSAPASEATAPRIETSFRNYKAGIKPDYKAEFDESNYFSLINGKFVAAKKYADYKIKDTRLKTK